MYGSPDGPGVCPLCDTEVYSPADDICEDADMEHRWRRAEHLALGLVCPCAAPAGQPRERYVDILREDLLRAVEGEEVVTCGVHAAFPDLGLDVDSECARRRAVSPSLWTLPLRPAVGGTCFGACSAAVCLVAGFVSAVSRGVGIRRHVSI